MSRNINDTGKMTRMVKGMKRIRMGVKSFVSFENLYLAFKKAYRSTNERGKQIRLSFGVLDLCLHDETHPSGGIDRLSIGISPFMNRKKGSYR